MKFTEIEQRIKRIYTTNVTLYQEQEEHNHPQQAHRLYPFRSPESHHGHYRQQHEGRHLVQQEYVEGIGVQRFLYPEYPAQELQENRLDNEGRANGQGQDQKQ